MDLQVDRGDSQPLYRQIVEQVQTQIESGEMAPGTRLPPVREVANRYGLTRLTVHTAYLELQQRGLVHSWVGRGTYVRGSEQEETQRLVPPEPWTEIGPLASLIRAGERRRLISLAQAYPAPESFPTDELRRCLERAAGDPAALMYGPIGGDAGLREQVARIVAERGVDVPPEHLLITSGGQQGIDIALRALSGPQDVVIVEEPTYPGILQSAAARGQRVIGVPGDRHGIRTDLLEYAVRTYRPRVLYLVPSFGNPTGIPLSDERRETVMRLALAHDLYVIEDDIYGLLPHESQAPPAMKSDERGERIVYLNSFSKSLAPGVRIGVLAASPDLLPDLAAVKQGSDLVTSGILQRALALYLERGLFRPHVERARALYRERKRAMLAALTRELPEATWTMPEGGLNLWLTLPGRIDETELIERAADAGMAFAPGSLFFAGAQRHTGLRLSFGTQTPERIEAAVGMLAGAVRSCMQVQPERRVVGLAAPLV